MDSEGYKGSPSRIQVSWVLVFDSLWESDIEKQVPPRGDWCEFQPTRTFNRITHGNHFQLKKGRDGWIHNIYTGRTKVMLVESS